jgi:hypothetical protein
MKITVQIAVQSDEGQAAVIQEVACLERSALRPDTLGLSLVEARSILAGLEQTMAQRQAAEFVAQERRCLHCGQERACKGHHRIVFRTPFGKPKLDSPQLYRCACGLPRAKTFSPLAEAVARAHLAGAGVFGNEVRGLGLVRAHRQAAEGGVTDSPRP